MNQFSLHGTKITLTNNNGTFDHIKSYDFSRSNYICVAGLMEFLEGYINEDLQKAFNESFLNPVHSPFIKLYVKTKGYRDFKTLDPVWLLIKLLSEDFTHYFYGASNETLSKIKSKIEKEFPRAKIVGYKSPPYVGLDEIKDNDIIKRDIEIISNQKPNIIWIGIGGVKQDLLMFYYKKYLESGLMIGVGAVFDVFAGNIKLRPAWVKRIGLSWLYYLIQQPNYRTSHLLRFFPLPVAIVKKMRKHKKFIR